MGVDETVTGGARLEGRLVDGEVVEQLPSALFRVVLADRTEVLAHVSDRRAKDFLRLLPGDHVQVRLPRNGGRRGRIVKRNSK